jgi:hypothetical protein
VSYAALAAMTGNDILPTMGFAVRVILISFIQKSA